MIIIADNLRITNRIVEQAVRDLNPEPIQSLVLKCGSAGAEYIDINSGPLSRDPVKKMTFLIQSISSVCDLPVLIDTVNPIAIETGLAILKNKTIINGFSLEPVKLKTILPLARRYDAAIIGYLLYPNGHVPKTADEKMNVAVDLFKEFQKTGHDPEKLIIDPVVAPLLWEDGLAQNRHVLTVIRNLSDLLGFPVKTIAGLSNLTAGIRPESQKRELEQAFLPMMAASGLDYILMNVFNPDTVKIANACKVLCQNDIFTWPD